MSKKKRDAAALAAAVIDGASAPTEATIPAVGDALADQLDAETLRAILTRTEAELALASGRFDAAKAFLLESETRSAALRKIARAVVLELKRGTLTRVELATMLEEAIAPPAVVTEGPVPE